MEKAPISVPKNVLKQEEKKSKDINVIGVLPKIHFAVPQKGQENFLQTEKHIKRRLIYIYLADISWLPCDIEKYHLLLSKKWL